MLIAPIAAGLRAQEHQKGAQTLAAAANDVLGDLVDKDHVGVQAALDESVHGPQIVSDQEPYRLQIADGRDQAVRCLHGAHCQVLRNWPISGAIIPRQAGTFSDV
jgi:hypothetical protein